MSSKIVEEISKMSVMELAELVKTLETKFGVSAAAPMAASAPAASSAPVAAAAQQEEKNEFKVILKDAGADKIKVIKALRSVTTLALGAAKEAVESAPFTVSEAAPKEDAQKIKKALEEAGAKVELA